MRVTAAAMAAILVAGQVAWPAFAQEGAALPGPAPASGSDIDVVALPSSTAEAAEISAISDATADEVASRWITLPRDTPIHLMVISEVTTKTHSAGYRFRLRVNEPVMIDSIEVVPVGAIAWGEVISASSSGNVGKSGQIEARLLYLEVAGDKIPIEGTRSDKGKSGTAETVMGVIGLGVFGLFAKGNNAKIKAGEKITAFTVEDVQIDVSKAS